MVEDCRIFSLISALFRLKSNILYPPWFLRSVLYSETPRENSCLRGGAKNAGVEKSARSKMQGWKMHEWNLREGMRLKDLNSCAFTTLS